MANHFPRHALAEFIPRNMRVYGRKGRPQAAEVYHSAADAAPGYTATGACSPEV